MQTSAHFNACTNIREVLELGKPKQESGAFNPSNDGMVPTASDHAESLGVRKREDTLKQNTSDVSNDTTEDTLKQNTPDVENSTTEDTLKQNTSDVTNVTTAPSQEDHADDIGVARETVNRWEKDRKEIHPQNCGMVPTASDHADALGIQPRGGNGSNCII